ncbi:hypothetical protein CEXT_608881 [Caerostris extrusa]|uniref:Uncharacterized protein n=1 Tax=Caerostris extrusa TaxID=172846 RepID=A0AAV4XFT0_CAEEX|nr:hypothetical protein CEXT_608881 [Caerostris extrusa]
MFSRQPHLANTHNSKPLAADSPLSNHRLATLLRGRRTEPPTGQSTPFVLSVPWRTCSFWGIFLTATVYPVYVEGLVSCSPNPCKNGASCVTNPKGESYCNHTQTYFKFNLRNVHYQNLKRLYRSVPLKFFARPRAWERACGPFKNPAFGKPSASWLQTFRC